MECDIRRPSVGALLVCLFGLLLPGISPAYKAKDHLVLSKRAAYQSILGKSPDFIRGFGLEAWGANSFVNNVDGSKDNTAIDLIAYGAEYEDDLFPDLRVLNHFYDPQYRDGAGRALMPGFGLGEVGHTSPDWALEDNGDVTTRAAPFQLPGRPQRYSLREAEQYFLAALSSPSADRRQLEFADFFQTLGHVVHHVQDMAQPQHTRNEQHLPLSENSFFEHYTFDLRYRADPAYRRDRLEARRNELLRTDLQTWDNYPVPAAGTFAKARHFWTAPAGSSALYTSMADFTARNFLSSDTGFTVDATLRLEPDPEFPAPNGSGAYVAMPELVEFVRDDGSFQQEYATLIKASIYDGYLNRWYNDIPVAAYSLLTDHGADLTLANRFVYEQQYPLLLPRSVAFSAGLINHFFRGRVSIRRDSDDLSKWAISNVGTLPMTGQFAVYTENTAGYRQPAGAGPWSRSLAPGQSFKVSFPEPAVTPEQIVLTFAGTVNGDSAVAGKVRGYDELPTLDVSIVKPSAAEKSDWKIRNNTGNRLTGEFRIRSEHESGETQTRSLGFLDLSAGQSSAPFSGSKLGDPETFRGKARVLFDGAVDGSSGELSLSSAEQDLPEAPFYRMIVSAEANDIGVGWVDYDLYDSLGGLLGVIKDAHLDVQVPATQRRTIERRYWPNGGAYGDVGSPAIFCLGPLNSWCDYSVQFFFAGPVPCVSNPFAPDGTAPYVTPLDSRLRAVTAQLNDWPKVASWCLANETGWP